MYLNTDLPLSSPCSYSSYSLQATENHMLIELNGSSRLRSLPCMALASFSTILSNLQLLHDLKGKEEDVEREKMNYHGLRKDHETASTQQIIDEPLGNFWNSISTTFISCSGADDLVLNEVVSGVHPEFQMEYEYK